MQTSRATEVLDVLVLPVERTRLVARARGWLSRGIVVLAAAAGYGKTTLLRLIARATPQTLWVPLTIAHQDVAFLKEQLQPHLAHRILLLDDVHVLEGATEALDWLGAAVQARPWGWVISGRWIPPPLTHTLQTLAAHYITEKDLAFTLEEVTAWLHPLGYEKEALVTWHERTHGWPLAIAALAHISTRYAAPTHIETDLEEFLDNVVFLRLWEELPDPLRRYLLLTGVAIEFSFDLAAHLWKHFAPANTPAVQTVWHEVVRRHLFLEPGTRAGHWRYHALFRAFLRRQTPDRHTIAHLIVQWHREHGHYEEAIEQALSDELWEDATQLLLDLPERVVRATNRIYTYRRWILTLPPSVREAHPTLLTRLGAALCAFGQGEEGLTLVREGVALIQRRGTPEALCRAYRALAWSFLRTGDAEHAALYARNLLGAAMTRAHRREASLLLGHAAVLRGRLIAAREHYRRALALVEEDDDPLVGEHIRGSLAAGVLAPLGHLKEALALLQENLPFARQHPSVYLTHLEQWASVYIEGGDWVRAQEQLDRMEGLNEQGEAVDVTTGFWRAWCEAMCHIGQGRLEDARHALVEMARAQEGRPDRLLFAAQVHAWLARREGHPEEAMRAAEEALAHPRHLPYARGVVALERDIAATEALPEPPSLHPDTLLLIHQRALPQLLRLRGLLVWRCYRAGNEDMARHHLRRLLAVARRFPHLRGVLTTRDPELNLRVWRVALLLGEAEEVAEKALGQLGQPAALADLLAHPDPRVRCRAARALETTQREESMPFLQRALEVETLSQVKDCLRRALQSLEALPPPPLDVHFLGAFRVLRGGREIPDDAWPRPAVVRLFQYLVLHRGQPLSRERILEDLWPGQDPERARQTLRRLLSWLRQVLEPYMHPRGPLRYLRTTWDVYTFDPQNRVRVDVEAFEQQVESVLASAETAPVPPLPEAFLAALDTWAPPVGVAPYEDWWVRRVERWRDLYVQGCEYAARAYLARHAFRSAIEWADRALREAPWLESAYRVKMRALSRMGQRAQALSVYNEAREALHRELGVEPSLQTEWLAQRLRRGEEI